MNAHKIMSVSTAVCLVVLLESSLCAQTNSQVFAWNNLGMHCMDDDFSVFAILPPYNTIHAQVVSGVNGTAHRIDGTGFLQVNYQGVHDANNSINTTSVGKGNFWTYVTPMLGAVLAPDAGLPLTGYTPAANMPGSGNPFKPMNYESGPGWFVAWGIPITPFDDELNLNPYPMMRIVTSGGGIASATNDIVLPVSTEMDCRACHASGSGIAARPDPDWIWNPVPTLDYRLNILRLHDQVRFQEMPDAYTNVLTAAGFNTQGLYASAVKSGRPILCALCHLSEAVPGSGQPDVPALTEAIHGLHADVRDPTNGQLLGVTANRTACYRCHPGAETRCLRGAMGRAVAPDGSLAIQCQDCHGSMGIVGDPGRTGWLNEPTCQACHTGDAVANDGQIRYFNVYTNGVMREPLNRRFATNTNAPQTGLSLFRFSKGHGGLYCSACHGSTHAIFPSAFFNDNVASMQHQGHAGQMSECSSCHGNNPTTVTGGPHGMHRLAWTGGGTTGHRDYGKNPVNCQVCHGTTYRGTELSRSFKDQTLTGRQGAQTYWRGRRIGCYDCHNGVSDTGGNPPAAPTATSRSAATTVNQPVAIALTASTSLLRIVSQPSQGTVGLGGTTATYTPPTGFIGVTTFTFCSDSGFRESNLATVTVTVSEGGPCTFTLDTDFVFFDELGHVDAVHVTTDPDCEWTAASESLWLTMLSHGGPGSGDVRYAVARNTDSAMRMGTLSVAGKTVTVIQDGAPADANSDGLPDSWQVLYFSNAMSPDANPSLDFDGDGMTNLQEYLAGTDPTDPLSLLNITSFSVASAEQAFQLAFPSLLNRYYQIQRTADLMDPEWLGFTNAVFGTGATLPLAGPTSADAPAMFYRVHLVN